MNCEFPPGQLPGEPRALIEPRDYTDFTTLANAAKAILVDCVYARDAAGWASVGTFKICLVQSEL